MNKKIKICLLVVMFIVMLLLLTGCTSKTAISTNTFKSIATDNNYYVQDVTSQYYAYGNMMKEATIAQSTDGYQLEFFVLSDESNAIGMFNTNQATFESYKSGVSSQTSASVGNYSTYTLESAGYYMHLCRVDNTLLYVRVPSVYKDAVKSIIKQLGY